MEFIWSVNMILRLKIRIHISKSLSTACVKRMTRAIKIKYKLRTLWHIQNIWSYDSAQAFNHFLSLMSLSFDVVATPDVAIYNVSHSIWFRQSVSGHFVVFSDPLAKTIIEMNYTIFTIQPKTEFIAEQIP